MSSKTTTDAARAKFQSPGHYTKKDREKIRHFAGPHESFPIEVPQDVEDAAGLHGHAADPAAVKSAIIRIAKELGPEFEAKLPQEWKDDMSKNKRSAAADSAVVDEPTETRDAGADSAGTIEQVVFAPVVRVDEGKREVTVCATSEAVDSFKTRFDYDASKDAFTRWIGNVREMHQPKAVGN